MFGKPPSRRAGILAWMWFFIRPEGWRFFLLSFNRTWRSAIFSLQPFIIGIIVDAVESGRAMTDPWLVWNWLLIYLAFNGVIYIMLFVSIFEARHLDRVCRRAKLFCVDHLMSLSLERHEHSGTGAQMQRIGRACSSLRNLMNTNFTVITIVLGSFIGVALSIIFLKVPFYFHLLYLGFIFSFILVPILTRRKIPVYLTRHNQMAENLSKKVYDYISAIRTLKNFDLSRFVCSRAQEGESKCYNTQKPIIHVNYSMWVILSLVGLFWFMVIVSFSFKGVIAGTVTIGAFASMAAITYRLWTQLNSIAVVVEQFSSNKNGLLRISKLLNTPSDNLDKIKKPVDYPSDWESINIQDLQFSYRHAVPVLKDVSMVIPRNKRIALIGRSGSGKSTLAKLLMKQIAPDSGTLDFGNVPICRIPRSQILEKVTLVPQDVELFNGNIRENIVLDHEDLSEEVYQDCLHKSYMLELIDSLPAGDMTQIGERGMRLSGGQRQRLGIARALARQSDLIIFDEATSSLDSESENFIQRAIESSFNDKTLLVIAHRLSTIIKSDLIYVLDDGEIKESGDFVSLMAKKGIFSKLWSMQSEGFISA